MEARRYGRFIVQQTLGSGGMGDVYRAHDDRLGRDVAIKTIRNVAGLDNDAFRARFMAEARALAAISHPAIVSIHDLGIENDEPFLILELVDGPSLKGVLEHGPLPPAEVRAMGAQIARALASAHARQILHRDLKPANILRSSDGQWKLADFGIARVPDSDLTLTGQFLGTPAYAAPESLVMGQFSDRSDVYSLAATMVEAATGAKLRTSTGMTELLQRGDFAAELPSSIPEELARPLRRALAIDPKNRPSAEELAGLLEAQPNVSSGSMAAPVAASPQTVVLGPVATVGPVGAVGAAPTVAGRSIRMARMSPRTRMIALAVGGLVVVGVLAAILSSGGSSPSERAAKPAAPSASPLSRPTRDREREPEAASDLPPIEPGRVTVVPPKDLDGKSAKDFSKVVDKIRDGKFDEALKKLTDYERKYDSSPETAHLRAQLEAIPWSDEDDD